MKKVLPITFVALLIFSLVSGNAFAAKGGNSNTNQGSTPNGKPFTYLNDQIQDQADAIAALEAETQQLRAEISVINTQISSLEINVSANSQSIADLGVLLDILRDDLNDATQDLNAKIAQLRSDLETELAQTQADLLAAKQNLQAQLDQTNADLLAVEHDLDAEIASVAAALASTKQALEQQIADIDNRISVIDGQLAQLTNSLGDAEADILALFGLLQALEDQHEADIASIQLQIDGLSLQIQGLAANLASETAQLQAAIDSNSGNISSLLLNVSGLTAQIVLLDNQVDNHETRLTSLEGSLVVVQSSLAELEDRITVIETNIDPVAVEFDGIQNDVAIDSLAGWEVCHTETYRSSSRTPINTIRSNCTGAQLMLACRPTGSDTLRVAANASRDDVLFDTGRTNNPHLANGVNWYFNDSYSWGFAPEGENISRSSCDIINRQNNDRLCWHTGGGRMSGGWRCGSATSLNSSNSFEKVILQHD